MTKSMTENNAHEIDRIEITPLRMPLKTPYVWSQGIEEAFIVNLVSMTTADGLVGYGETTTAPDALAQKAVLEKLSGYFVNRSVFDFERRVAASYKGMFLAFGGNMPRYANQMYAGLEMAALDLQGKILGRPVWDLLGGAQREEVGYFYFLQGESIDALATDGAKAAAEGHPVIYLKVGVGEAYDVAAVKAVRESIGDRRLRLDANEAWDVATALRMIAKLEPYDIEYIEQPTPSTSLEALRQVRQRSPIAIGADQSVFTLQEVFQACATNAADMIVVGPRETGGLRNLMKAAAVTEASGTRLCIHSSMTTGITTCAEHHLARAITHIDDANQIMWQLLRDNIIRNPPLTPVAGKLSLPARPGLGFDLDDAAVEEAANRFKAV